MSFQVEISVRAAHELRAATRWIARDNPQAAERWFRGFAEAMQSLSENPRSCGYAQEHGKFPFELRQLLYGRRKTLPRGLHHRSGLRGDPDDPPHRATQSPSQ